MNKSFEALIEELKQLNTNPIVVDALIKAYELGKEEGREELRNEKNFVYNYKNVWKTTQTELRRYFY